MWLLLFLFPIVGAAAPMETVTSTQGAPLCCRSDFWKCRKRCAPQGCLECAAPEACVERCEKAACRPRACEGVGDRPDGKELRGDGRLTGPGEIRFQAFNRHTGKPPLQVIGVVFGRDPRGVPVPLKKTPTVEVLPGSDSRFQLRVNPEEFAEWTRSYGVLTVGLTYPDIETSRLWTFENLLTQADVANAMPGEFQVKGAFHPASP